MKMIHKHWWDGLTWQQKVMILNPPSVLRYWIPLLKKHNCWTEKSEDKNEK